MIVDANPLFGNNRTFSGLNVQENDEWTTLRGLPLRVQPVSHRQQVLIHRCTQISNHWTVTLNGAQQTAWETYAMITAYPHPTKVVIFLTGPAMFRAANLPRLAGGLSIISNAPVGAGLATFTDPTFVILPTNKIQVTIDNTDPWAANTGGVMAIAIGRPVQAGTRNRSRQFISLVRILGNTAAPPANITEHDNPWTNPNVHTQWFGWHVTDQDGRPGPAE